MNSAKFYRKKAKRIAKRIFRRIPSVGKRQLKALLKRRLANVNAKLTDNLTR